MSTSSAPASRREIWSWGLYDFANSAFATSILAVVYATFFQKHVVPPEWRLSGEVVWNYAGALSMIVICASAPVIGAITDYTGAKKRWLFAYWMGGVLATAGLVFVKPGMIALGAGLFILANMGFAGGNAIYNSFLTEISPPDRMARVSSFGWALGYIGGGLCLLANLIMLRKGTGVSATFAVVAAWWLVFALPLFFWLRERAAPKPRAPGRSLVGIGFSNVFRTLKEIRKNKELFKFLLAYLLFNEGVETVIINAAGYGQRVVGLQPDRLILVYLLVQGVAVGGAFLFGEIAERIRGKRTLFLSLFVWLGVLVYAFFTASETSYWILGCLVGLVMGGTQAISRAFFGMLTPREKTAEFFGFFAIGGKFAAALGPVVFGTVTHLTGTMRWGIVSIAIFFIAGMILLASVDEEQGRLDAAKAA